MIDWNNDEPLKTKKAKRRPGPPLTTGGGDSTLYVRDLPSGLKQWCKNQAVADGRSLSSWVRQQLQAIRAKAESKSKGQ
jgi:hypothetical protein